MGDVYERTLETILERHIATLVFYFVCLFFALALIWLCGILSYMLYNDKIKPGKLHLIATILSLGSKPPKKGKNGLIQLLTILIVITLILSAIWMLLLIPEMKDIHLIKQDITENAYITYEGNYRLSDRYNKFFLEELWLDERLVTLTDTENQELVWLDLSGVWEGWMTSYGESQGTIVYGKHSKRIIYIDGLEGLWE